jgi:CTP:molybdopterin cytidylyltransferase MocA
VIPAIVLAAGRSARFGRPKALARIGDETFISRIIRTLREAGVAKAVVVSRPDDDDLMLRMSTDVPFATRVTNPDPERGQLSSLLAGLEAVDGPGVPAVLVTLVDVPLVTAPTIRHLLDRAMTSDAAIVRPAHGARHGHPVIFRRVVFDALRHADPARGAKDVFGAFAVEDVEVSDAGAFEDIDTPADYERVIRATD